MRFEKVILFFALAIMFAGCHKTAPQSPSQRSGQEPQPDSTVVSLIEMNRLMVAQADADIMAYVDSVQKATGSEYAQMSCGGWKRRRTMEEKHASLFADAPQSRERWNVRLRTYNFHGKLLKDEKGVYTLKRFDLPIAVEEAIEEMYPGETSDVVAPWYAAYGYRGKGPVGPYECVAFKVTLIEKMN